MYGATDLPVTPRGLEEIREIAAEGIYPPAEGADIYTSGMLRTEQTLEAIYGNLPHEKEPLLREFNVGPYEMKTVEEIMRDEFGRSWLRGELEDPHFEGGDSMSGFAERTLSGVRGIIEKGLADGAERLILVIHGGVITSVMHQFFPGTYSDMWRWTPTPGYGYAVELDDGVPEAWTLLGDAETGNVPRI